MISEHPERREALPDHPLPARLAAPDTWQLRVDGLVAQPLVLALHEVDALAAQAHTADFVCEEGWVVPEQQWAGVAIAALLARADVQPGARFLTVHAGDYTVQLPLEEALAGGALLARSLNGQPLTPAHGAPLRLVAPGRVCWYSVKWVDRLEVLADEAATTGEGLARVRVRRRRAPPAGIRTPPRARITPLQRARQQRPTFFRQESCHEAVVASNLTGSSEVVRHAPARHAVPTPRARVARGCRTIHRLGRGPERWGHTQRPARWQSGESALARH